VRSLAEPLRAATDALLKSTAYQESLFLRGIYLTGWSDDVTAFLGELLERKVFAETGLATPTARTVFATNRAVRIAQIAAAVAFLFFGSGLWWAWRKLERENEVLGRFLATTAANMESSSRTSHDAIADATLKSWADDLLDGMAAINFRHYGSVFVPSSWFSPFDAKLSDAITQSFNKIILESIRLQMEERARTLYTAPAAMQLVTLTPDGAVVAPAGTLTAAPQQRAMAIEQMPEFVALQRYVDDMSTLESNAQVFNSLHNRGDLKGFSAVVSYALQKQLPDRFFERAELYQRALANSTYRQFDAAAVSPQATAHLEELTAELYRALYERNAFAGRLQQLSELLQQASWQWPVAGEADRFTDLRVRFKDVETQLSGPEMVWAFRPTFSLSPAYDLMLSKIDRSQFFAPGVSKRMRDAGFAGWSHFRQTIAQSQSPLTGTLLATQNGQAEMRLSTDALLLESALDTFLSQGFVASTAARGHIQTSLPASSKQVWDPALIEQAAGVAHAYDRFRDKTLERFPADLRLAIDQVSRERANAQMVDLLAEAQSFPNLAPSAATEDDLRAGVAAFSATLPAISDALDGFARLGFADSRHDLAAAETAEALRLLRVADSLLDQEQPYRPRQGGFAWWDGSGAPSPAAWGVRDAADVAAYLDTTRARVTTIARGYAQPVLSWLGKSGTDRGDAKLFASKWQSILDDLRDYDAKKPGNSLALLEDYAGVQMTKVGTSDCVAATLPASFKPGRGFFSASLYDLSKQLAGRCYLIAGKDASARYTELARYFNQRLAGRYPFAEAPPRAGEPEAEPDDLRAFYRLYDASQAVIRSMPLDGGGVAPSFASARQFLDDIASVRAFFAPFLDAKKAEPSPSFDVETTFRVLREREVDGNQIIGWSLAVGDDVVTNHDKKRKLRWMPGQPVRLTLRWASDSPRVPVLPAAVRGASVRDRSIVYEYTNRWSLLTALGDHTAASDELPSYADSEPVTLAFAVYTQPADAPPSQTATPKPAQVFARVALLAPGTTQTLDVPRFPQRAPRLDGPIVAEESR
jgi:type VI secretion system protein ImpL